ncbi:MAG: type II toxin-antitoxin system VapC family toxin [Deltaproteobacteria bacterium]|nr:type II toxin-antitoxin system VapC family toxin [Deltaproteobacteria bacterium]
MIVYLDTSSLVKLYIEEDQSSEVEGLVKSSEVTVTSLVAYAEARAAFARRFREKAFAEDAYESLKNSFDNDWGCYLALSVTEKVIRLAGNLAEKHALRGFDAIHLASALTLREEMASPIVFSCFDDHLLSASDLENLDQA